MAGSSVPEVTKEGSPAQDTPMLSDSDHEAASSALQLNGKWTLGAPILKEAEKHAAVYSLLDSKTGQLEDEMEAHVLVLDRFLEPKLRKYRLRRIKRMKHRTNLELKVGDLIILVITTTSPPGLRTSALEHEPSPHSLSTGGQPEVIKVCSEVNMKVIPKTAYQQESARLRQRERRQAKRSAKVSKGHEGATNQPEDPEKGTEEVRLDFSDSELSIFLLLLWVIYDGESLQIRARILPQHASIFESYETFRKLVEEYMGQSKIAPKSVEAMESYLKFRRSELVSLRRQQAKITSAEKHYENKLEQMVQRQVKHIGSSVLERELIAEATLHYKMAIHAKAVLPKLLAQRKSAIRALERKLAAARNRVASEKLQDQRYDLEDKLRQYDGWLKTAFPLSGAHEDLLAMRELARSELAAFDLRYLE